MNITKTKPNVAAQTATTRAPADKSPKKEVAIKQDMYDVADRYSSSRSIANGVTGFAVGAATGLIDGAIKAPAVAWEIAENCIQAETIGPNLKVLGTLAAVPGGALSAVASPFVQAFKDGSAMAKAGYNPDKPLENNGSNGYAAKKFSGDNNSFSSGIMSDLEEFGSRKLSEGEKPYDVPILSPIFSVVGGVVSGAISASTGLVGGLAAGLLTTVKEIGGAVFGGNQSFGKRVGRAATAPLHSVAIPYGLVKEGLKESVPRGFVDGWKHGPIKPVVDTAKASTKLAAGVLKEAWER